MTRSALKGRLILFLVLIIPLTLYAVFYGDTYEETVTWGTETSRTWTDVQFEDFSSDFENAGNF